MLKKVILLLLLSISLRGQDGIEVEVKLSCVLVSSLGEEVLGTGVGIFYDRFYGRIYFSRGSINIIGLDIGISLTKKEDHYLLLGTYYTEEHVIRSSKGGLRYNMGRLNSHHMFDNISIGYLYKVIFFTFACSYNHQVGIYENKLGTLSLSIGLNITKIFSYWDNSEE